VKPGRFSLRKAGATRAAENGARERELMAMFGWSTGKQARHDTRAADRKQLAVAAAQKLLKGRKWNRFRPHLDPGAGCGLKSHVT